MNRMMDDVPWTLLDRYFSGECSPEECARIVAWEDADPEHARLLKSLREIWEHSSARRRFGTDAAWASIQRQLAAPDPWSALDRPDAVPVNRPNPAAVSPLRHRSWAARALRTAAAVVVLAASVGTLVKLGIGERSEPPMHAYTTEVGHRTELRLADGTRVVLSAATRLRVPSEYGKGARAVYLDRGEAFFEVRHDASRPFRVHVPGAVAEDLGTEFLVRTDGRDNPLQVVVASGEVALRADSGHDAGGVVLAPGQLGRVHRSGRVEVDSAVDVNTHLAWMDGRIAFERAPLAAVLKDLERWYGTSIGLADSALSSVPVTATFEGQAPGEIVRILEKALDVRSRRTGDVIVLVPPDTDAIKRAP